MSTIEGLLLRFDAPLMSFGGVQVDENNTTETFPGLSLLTGLLGNALGYDHREAVRLDRLQQRLRYAVRRDRKGRQIRDYQTVDLGQDFMREGWTTRGVPGRRDGSSSAKTGTHIRRRFYWADSLYTVAITLEPANESPTLTECAEALQTPQRPLYLGRKPCVPSTPLFLDHFSSSNLREALLQVPLPPRADPEGALLAWWPEEEQTPAHAPGRRLAVYDQRDWTNRVHTGRRFMWEGQITPEEITDGE